MLLADYHGRKMYSHQSPIPWMKWHFWGDWFLYQNMILERGVGVVWLCNECDCCWWLNFSWDLYWWLNMAKPSSAPSICLPASTVERCSFYLKQGSPGNAGRMPQLKRVVDHNGQQWHLLGFGDQPPKPDLQKGHTERSVETPSVCFVWIKKGWHFWELEGHLLKPFFSLTAFTSKPSNWLKDFSPANGYISTPFPTEREIWNSSWKIPSAWGYVTLQENAAP